MTRRNQTVERFLLSVAAFLALCAPGRAQVGRSPSPADGGQIRTAAVKTNGCRSYLGSVCPSGEIIKHAAEAKAILEGGRYTQDGSGPALYVWLSQDCSISQAFLKDRARFDGVQFRYYPVPWTNRDQYVQTMVSRSLPDFLSYMDKTPRVPPARPDLVRDSAYNDLRYRTMRLQQIMVQNRLHGISTPSFFWIGRGKVFWTTGYSQEYVAQIIASVKSYTAGPQETVGSPAAGEITAAAAEVKTLLEGGRYTADGSGPSLYAWVSPTSSFSKEFFRDRAQFGGVQFRYYPMPLAQDSSDQMVQAMGSRLVPDFLSYMNQTLRAPPYGRDNARIDILNDLVRRNQRLEAILTQNDGVNVSQLNLLSPWWFWIANGKVYWTFGYTPEYLTEIVASLISSSAAGGHQALQTAPLPVPSGPPNPAPSSPPAPQRIDNLRVVYAFTDGADRGNTFTPHALLSRLGPLEIPSWTAVGHDGRLTVKKGRSFVRTRNTSTSSDARTPSVLEVSASCLRQIRGEL